LEHEINARLLGRPHGSPTVSRPSPDRSLVEQSAVGRRIWGSPDAILLIFAGSAAEFAVNKAVDWLFWTNALPDAPIDRFFETVRFAQAIAFGDEAEVARAVEAVNRAHRGVERSRGDRIPQWAYRDVLFMLIDYGERAHEILWGSMSPAERIAHFEASVAIGRAMHIEGLPATYADYRAQRLAHLRDDTAHTELTDRLYERYRQHLGVWRMRGLLDLQASLVPLEVARLLGLQSKRRVEWLLRVYHRIRSPRVLRRLYRFALPDPYGRRLATLER
jgi:uncharacterized protein (DUF2236 family)